MFDPKAKLKRRHAMLFNSAHGGGQVAKARKERRIVRLYVAGRYEEHSPFAEVRSCLPPLPDCELIGRDGSRTLVEVTEFVDQAAIENFRLPYRWKEYTAHEFCSALWEKIEVKDRKLGKVEQRIAGEEYKKTVLVIHTDEPGLSFEFCRKSLSPYQGSTLQSLDEVFMLLGSRRMHSRNELLSRFCQVLPVFIRPQPAA